MDENKGVFQILGVLTALRHMIGALSHTVEASNPIREKQLLQVNGHYVILIFSTMGVSI